MFLLEFGNDDDVLRKATVLFFSTRICFISTKSVFSQIYNILNL